MYAKHPGNTVQATLAAVAPTRLTDHIVVAVWNKLRDVMQRWYCNASLYSWVGGLAAGGLRSEGERGEAEP